MSKNTKTDPALLIERLLAYSLDNLSLKSENLTIVRNNLLDLFRLSEPGEPANEYGDLQRDILNPLIDYAVGAKLIKDIDALLFETRIMGLVTPMPSDVIDEFDCIASRQGIECATEFFYDLSIKSNYIRMVDIDKNIRWQFTGSRGDIKVTINLSKPEKDPKEVLAAAKQAPTNYPKCRLCAENVGFAGNYNYPARQTLRTIPIFLNEENWYMQYSPYCYFEEHLIALSDEHRPMLVDKNAITRMLDFVEIFPHYFIGSNAALPIVGGSILAHDHYQGGAKVMPMMSAGIKREFISPAYSSVTLSVLDWYNTVVRLSGPDRYEIIKAADHLMLSWANYSDESMGIYSKTTEQHNAVTPVIRIEDNTYVIDFVLRNNRTDEKHPFGIFHPTEDLHNIKKESIGIIEVMGLFILPGRLYIESDIIKQYLTGEKKLDFKEIANENNPMYKHLPMIAQLTNDNGTSMQDADASEAIMNYINAACEKILYCTSVFKKNEVGDEALDNFIYRMGYENL